MCCVAGGVASGGGVRARGLRRGDARAARAARAPAPRRRRRRRAEGAYTFGIPRVYKVLDNMSIERCIDIYWPY